MTSRDFVYWLQGYFEISDTGDGVSMTDDQVKMIQKHLNLVFKHEIDPSMGDAAHQKELNQIHNQSGFPIHGPCPAEGWELDPLHGWFDPKGGRPRC